MPTDRNESSAIRASVRIEILGYRQSLNKLPNRSLIGRKSWRGDSHDEQGRYPHRTDARTRIFINMTSPLRETV